MEWREGALPSVPCKEIQRRRAFQLSCGILFIQVRFKKEEFGEG